MYCRAGESDRHGSGFAGLKSCWTPEGTRIEKKVDDHRLFGSVERSGWNEVILFAEAGHVEVEEFEFQLKIGCSWLL